MLPRHTFAAPSCFEVRKIKLTKIDRFTNEPMLYAHDIDCNASWSIVREVCVSRDWMPGDWECRLLWVSPPA